WSEDRGTGSGSDIYAMRFDGRGTPAASDGWPVSGLRLCGAVGEQREPRILESIHRTSGFDFDTRIYVTWEDARAGDARIYGAGTHFDAQPLEGWPVDGVLVSMDAGEDHSGALVGQDDGFAAIWEAAGRVTAQAVNGSGGVPASASWPAAG